MSEQGVCSHSLSVCVYVLCMILVLKKTRAEEGYTKEIHSLYSLVLDFLVSFTVLKHQYMFGLPDRLCFDLQGHQSV